MKKSFIIAAMILAVLLCAIPAFMQSQCPGAGGAGSAGSAGSEKTLVIEWQHKTCQSTDPCARCTNAPKEFKAAFDELLNALAKLDIKVVLDEKTDVKEGDRMRFNGKALEDLVGGRLVKQSCTSCTSGGSEGNVYSVLAIGSTVYEVTPASLIIKAGLLAASELFTVEPAAPCGNITPCGGCPGKQ